MKKVQEIIQQRNREYSEHPFNKFLKDKNINPYKRLSFLPHTIFFVMSFGDMNRLLLPDYDSTDPIQQMLNTHGEEDAKHWAWCLHDLDLMGYNQPQTFNKTVKSIWSKDTTSTRRFCYDIFNICLSSPPILKLVMVEALEAMGEIVLNNISAITQEIKLNKELKFLGDNHLENEVGHAIGSEAEDIENIIVPEKFRARAYAIVNKLFDGMEAFNTDILKLTLAQDKFEEFQQKTA